MSLLLSLVLVLSGCGAKPADNASYGEGKPEKAIELKMGITPSETSTWYQGATKFAELVKEKTSGKYDIKIYTNEHLI